MIPAFSAWTESPEPGISTSTTVSATPITSISLWPVPTVSRKTRSRPAASSTSSACSVASASPPRCPRVPIERMKTPGSRKWSESRMRSPSSAPFENGLDGSTEIDADRQLVAADVADERADQARLADPGRAGDAERVRLSRVRVELADEVVGQRVGVLDQRDRARRAPAGLRSSRPRAGAPASTCSRPRRKPRAGPFRRPRRSAVGRLGRPEARSRHPGRAGARRAPRRREAPPMAQTVLGPSSFVSGPAAIIPTPSTSVVGAHEQRERTAAELVRRAALDEERIADDRGAVADAGDCDGRPRRSRHSARPPLRPSRRRRGRSRSHRPSRARDAPAESPAQEASERETNARHADEEAVAEVSRVEGLLGEDDLSDVGAGGRQHDDVPRGENGEERARVAGRP